MKSTVIVGRAAAALDEVRRWASTLERQAHQAEQVRKERPAARVIFPEGDPLLDGDNFPRPHRAIVRNLAGEVFAQHKYYAANPGHNDARENHLNACAAWRLVLTARTLPEANVRLRLAVAASGKVVPRCNTLLEAQKK